MDNSYPSRPSSHRRQYSRTMAAAYNNSMPCTSSEKQCIATPPQPVTPEKLSEPQVFEFLYGIIFLMIHTALMTILAPVLGDDKKKRSSKRRESSKSPMTMHNHQQQQVDVSPEVIEEGAYGIPRQQQQQLPPAVDNSDCISVASHSSQHSSRSHTNHRPTILRRPSSEKKNKTVRLNVPRAQPPLGRIGCSSQRSTTSSSSSSSASSNNSGSSLSSSNDSERRRAVVPVAPVAMSTRRPRRSSPLRTMVTQRMAQTSYFLE